ncbi:hypothetical protein CPB84DRAFT_1794780 [Gymnopilus junonius]|uniref:Uncharacterized protein n=1 Tax=Gymnopilus junonius TaxID=109634 RepID=A0A9P5NC66_GYMJU|nr:hypothetical protein CPB84DRAFT_1794780 [Gymnopilus junonius]
MNSSWQPQEDPTILLSERTWLLGAILTGVGYGIVFTLYCLCIHQILRSRERTNQVKRVAMFTYITLITLFGTLFFVSTARMTQLSFIDNRLYPGGPAAFEKDMFSIPVNELGNVTFVLANWFADALVVWRCMIIYSNCRYHTVIVMAIPCLAYIGSLSMGVMWLIQVSASQSSPWFAKGINFTPPYFWLSLALNMTMTLAIVARLFVLRWRISSILGKQYGSQYTGVAAMLIESAGFYSSFSLLFLIPFALNHPLANTFFQMLCQIQIITPLMIICRVASGRAWSSDTDTQLFSVKAGINETHLTSLKFQAESVGSTTIDSRASPVIIEAEKELCLSNSRTVTVGSAV